MLLAAAPPLVAITSHLMELSILRLQIGSMGRLLK